MKASPKNIVKQRYKAGLVSLGIQVKESSQHLVEIAGVVGADFVKLDSFRWPVSPEMLQGLIQTAWSHQMMPWVASPTEFWDMMWRMDMGAQGLSIACARTAEDVQKMVDATYYAPIGRRESNRPLRFRGMSQGDYFDLARDETLLCAQIEDEEGISNLKEILKNEHLDVICVGSGDLAISLGVANDRNHPKVKEARKRIHLEALAAGKQVTVTQAVTTEGLDEAAYWVEQGVNIVTLDGPFKVLIQTYGDALKNLKGAIGYDTAKLAAE